MQQHVFFILITSYGNIWQEKYQNYEIRCFFKWHKHHSSKTPEKEWHYLSSRSFP